MDIIPEQNLIIPPNATHGDTHWCAAGIHCMDYPETTVKDDFKHQFDTPVSSLLAFILLTFFVYRVQMCNLWAQERMKENNKDTICGYKWKPIGLNEFMCLWGIMIFMGTRLTPG